MHGALLNKFVIQQELFYLFISANKRFSRRKPLCFNRFWTLGNFLIDPRYCNDACSDHHAALNFGLHFLNFSLEQCYAVVLDILILPLLHSCHSFGDKAFLPWCCHLVIGLRNVTTCCQRVKL